MARLLLGVRGGFKNRQLLAPPHAPPWLSTTRPVTPRSVRRALTRVAAFNSEQRDIAGAWAPLCGAAPGRAGLLVVC